MSKKQIFSTKTLVAVSALTAMSIVLTRILKIEIGETIRVSFGHLPILISGVLFGPLAGALTGLVADFVGTTFLSPYAWFPPLGITPVLMGLIPPLVRLVFFRSRPVTMGMLLAMLIPAYLLGPIAWSTLSLHWLYGVPLMSMLYTRVPVSLTVAVLEILVTCTLCRTGAFRPLGFDMGRSKNELRNHPAAHS